MVRSFDLNNTETALQELFSLGRKFSDIILTLMETSTTSLGQIGYAKDLLALESNESHFLSN
jgi:hypothetical protein